MVTRVLFWTTTYWCLLLVCNDWWHGCCSVQTVIGVYYRFVMKGDPVLFHTHIYWCLIKIHQMVAWPTRQPFGFRVQVSGLRFWWRVLIEHALHWDTAWVDAWKQKNSSRPWHDPGGNRTFNLFLLKQMAIEAGPHGWFKSIYVLRICIPGETTVDDRYSLRTLVQ